MDDRFPFGRHKGSNYADVPTRYLTWCLDTIDLFPETRERILSELESRDAGGNPLWSAYFDEVRQYFKSDDK